TRLPTHGISEVAIRREGLMAEVIIDYMPCRNHIRREDKEGSNERIGKRICIRNDLRVVTPFGLGQHAGAFEAKTVDDARKKQVRSLFVFQGNQKHWTRIRLLHS